MDSSGLFPWSPAAGNTTLLPCWLNSLRSVCQSFSDSPVGTRDLERREELQKESLRQAAAMLEGSHMWGVG